MKSRIRPVGIYAALLYRMALMMFIFTLCRTGFYLFNHKMFPGLTGAEFLSILRGGLMFDISALVYINVLFILAQIIPFEVRYNRIYQDISRYLFFIINGLAIAINCADFVYYRFVLKRATAEVFRTFQNESGLLRLLFRFQIDYWPVVLFGLALIFLMIFLYNRIKTRSPLPHTRIRAFVLNLFAVPVIIIFFIVAARGGYRHSTRPVSISNAAKYVKNPRDAAIVLNTPFSLIRTFDKKSLIRYSFFDDKKLNELYNPHYKPGKKGEFNPCNVVVIILESFSREYIGALNRDLDGGSYRGYSPFLDSLIGQSLTFTVSLANGKKSIDAMPSIFASIPSLETPYVISHYANNTINGLPRLLKDKGYYSAFFHGAPNGSMGFDSFARMAGFDDYFGLDQYKDKNDFDGMWGVWDEPFLDFFCKTIDAFTQPFFASVFTVSSHHPFRVPEKYKNKFPKGPAPILEVIGYTDYALQKFFAASQERPWFSNTLFVITADHTNETVRKEFQNDFGSYCIPIIFYKPGSCLNGIKNKIAQQIDIMPTVLAYLNYDGEYIAFGNNLFDDSAESFAFNTNGSTYHLYMKDHMIEMIDNKVVALYNFINDRMLQNNLKNSNDSLRTMMENKLRAVIQSYNNRLIDNNMIP
ncbi:MAG TPA: LTA synthase family protein [Bacteroidales bacterium]|nr:sulfatase-like hydrolase/transferase [Bacteroidales bacterium]HNR42921.1 LTA synthase family protein [Bacteroidales bacterium]HPM18842.1 LTA synthase family protein [Bacteroidales bacterium]